MITENLSRFFNWIGVEWVMVLLLALGLGSLILMLERWLFYNRRKVDAERLAQQITQALRDNNREAALAATHGQLGIEATVVAHGIAHLDMGAAAVEEMVQGKIQTERIAYERYLSFLGTLGNNAPFIGLFGTVLGVVGAFGELSNLGEGVDRARAIMGSISEALVATAAGLLVAIPCVIAYNYYKRLIATRAAQADALSHILLAHLKARSESEE
jgi:biopolymer transport protein ExbB/TolQ